MYNNIWSSFYLCLEVSSVVLACVQQYCLVGLVLACVQQYCLVGLVLACVLQ